ncbi:MAG: hypothetical protein A2015_12860 [Spirochaetes bacterium GWF1_31_7]|nr:MAG: hypothetical protein A2Y30_10650 [Spirochaetes bacterium GWE1_32_154]OHD49271.1 MAG: hypothetical protein A2Y29_16280 [Spirochaetes bacterium GWE2_31_10]OHD51833.1 MAG: hypothetical protein A2015_12860 [Spirochaetes bacterium GWF1_31_7]HBD95307.1 hypothetical protein [Spirochaetia bacterium]HBI39183.1 hypothetical protein [Spirochaetia bacterium]
MSAIIEQIIKEYLLCTNSDYAYLMTGSWGAGKTHFIKNDILKNKEINKEHKIIYYSLNGAEDINKVIRSIYFSIISFGKINPENEDLVQNTFDILENIDDKSFNIFLSVIKNFKDKTIESLFKKMKNSKFLIIFDDLERKSEKIDYTDLLGQIYSKLIEKNIKVIFISDESKIECNSYKSEKEKYIRRTLKFEINKKSIFEYLLNKNSLYNERLVNTLLDIFSDDETQPNLRSIIFALDVYEKLLNEYSKITNKEDYYNIEDYFYSIVVFCNEYKNGKIPDNEINKIIGINKTYSLDKLIKSVTASDTQKEWYTLFYEKNNKIEHPFDLPEVIINYIVEGYFDEKEFIKEIKKNNIEPQYELINEIRDYYYYYEIDDLKRKVNMIEQFIKDNKYKVSDISNIYSVVIELNNKIGLEYNISAFETLLLNFIDKNEEQIKELVNEYNYKESYSLTRNVIEKKINEIHIKYYKEKDHDTYDRFITSILKDDIESFAKIYRNTDKKDLFKKIIEYKLFERFSKLSNKSINLLIRVIYEEVLNISNAGKVLNDQIEYLEQLKSFFCSDKKNIISDKLKTVLYEDLIDTIKKAIIHIENTGNRARNNSI